MNHIKNKLRCRLTDKHYVPSAATVGPHFSALPTVQSVEFVKEYAAPSFTLTAFSTTQGCVSSLRCTWLCRLSRTFQRSRSMEHYHSHRLHMMTCGLFSNMFLCCIFIVQCIPASLRITHIINDMFVYIYIRPNVHVYYIHVYSYIYCVSVLAGFGPLEDSTLHFGPHPKKFAGPCSRRFIFTDSCSATHVLLLS